MMDLPTNVAKAALLSVLRDANVVATTFDQRHHVNQAMHTDIAAKRHSQLGVISLAPSRCVEIGDLRSCVVCKMKRSS